MHLHLQRHQQSLLMPRRPQLIYENKKIQMNIFRVRTRRVKTFRVNVLSCVECITMGVDFKEEGDFNLICDW